MDKETDKKLDEFTSKLLKNFSGETPSFDFTAQVMSRVEALSRTDITEYKPLISKKIWLILGVILAGVFSYLIFGDIQLENSWASSKVLDLIPKMNSITLPDYQISNVFLYSIAGLTFFICVQIFMLKNYFNRRLAAG